MMKGALEAFLKKSGAAGEAAALKIRPAASADEANLILFELSQGASTAQSSAGAPGGSVGPSGGISVSVVQPDFSGSDDERRQRLQLRNDAAEVGASSEHKANLAKYASMLAPEKGNELFLAVQNANSDSLKRLTTSDIDVEKALAGNQPSLSIS